jgi:RNA polymerase sigma-70 factor (ECF subfamily)
MQEKWGCVMNLDEMNKGIRTQNPEVYEFLMKTYSRLLWTIAAGILNGTGNREDVEDVISDVFLSLWEHPEQFDENRGSIKTWLCVKTRSRAIDFLRKRCREILPSEESWMEDRQQEQQLQQIWQNGTEEDTVLEQILSQQQMSEIVRQIEKQQSPDREILMLRLIYEVKPAVIAAKLQMSTEEVYERIRAGKRKLKKNLEGTK